MSLPLNELKAFESEIKNNFNELTDARKLLQDISDKVIQEAQTAINAANDTASYDEKIDSLVKGIQGIVKTVQDTKRSVDSAEKQRINGFIDFAHGDSCNMFDLWRQGIDKITA